MSQEPSPSFLWHDYETFGSDPRRDRPAEFACWRTNAAFEPIAEPDCFRCQPTLDYLPDPAACIITGIGPEAALRDGVPEPEFAARIQAQMRQAQTCSLGYNTIRFDDEITRHLFWRNFIDPYEREWAQGNSRFDLIDLARATYALRPQGIQWPLREDNNPSFKLGDLSAANALPHRHAHSALSDVEATLALARLLQTRQPRLVAFALELRRKARVLEMLNWRERSPVVHVSQRFPAERGCLAVVVPLAMHPSQAGKIIVVDAHHDCTPLLTWSAEDLAQALVAPAGTTPRTHLGLKLIHANRSPFLAPLSVLAGADVKRICLDRAQVDKQVYALQNAEELTAKVQQVYRLLDQAPRPPQDADSALYEGFVNDADRALMLRFHSAPPDELAGLAERFRDLRLRALAFRFRARHFSQTLQPNERQLWRRHCSDVSQTSPRSLEQFELEVLALASTHPELMSDLQQWGRRVRQSLTCPPASE